MIIYKFPESKFTFLWMVKFEINITLKSSLILWCKVLGFEE